ncbi:hypothetical protein J4Q44_G00120220 [Coregonus suidteri]|uniref:Uncharacterized protein n=1 Tax=Coregonus suidteri TaxID=861788 RepID=A0AAN8LWJ2_9TELE
MISTRSFLYLRTQKKLCARMVKPQPQSPAPRHPGSIDTINAPETPEPSTPKRQGSILGEENTHSEHNQRVPELHEGDRGLIPGET